MKNLLLISFGLAILCTTRVTADPIVASHVRLSENDEYQSTHAGRLLVSELGCQACHDLPLEEPSQKKAPLLANVGSRVKPAHLKKFILNPHGVKPGTTMPVILGKGDEAKAEAIAHFLVSLSPEGPEQGYATFGGRRRGDELYHSVGCAGCHDPNDKELATSVPLGDLPAKYTLPSLAEFLRKPHTVRPSGRMPSMNLTSREASDIASYLLPDVPEKAGIEYAAYEIGSVDRLPNFAELTPKESGTATEINVGKHKPRDDRFALRYAGALDVSEAGEYRFRLASDDGSKLLIDGDTVIDLDGVHGRQQKGKKIQLSEGRHSVTVEFFEKDGGEELEAQIALPGKKFSPLANELVSAAPQEPLEDLSFTVDLQLAKAGAQHFMTLGCANCHDVGRPTKTSRAKSLAGPMNAETGCLSSQVGEGIPNYDLSDKQRTTIRDYLAAKQSDRSDEQNIQFTMLQFNCVGCHQRGNLGGVEQERTALFQTTQKEMGIEGSIPPHLNSVGAKLTLPWLKNILAEGAKDRPYMLTRMPKFGADNVGHLADALAAADKTATLAEVAVDRREAKKIGHRLVGDKGFSCIKCHTFGRHKATGVQSIDMTIMTKRLRPDWFRSYVRNPQTYRPGTRMPSAWPIEGKSYLPDLLDGSNDKQIAAVWTFLKDGKAARTPSGLTTGSKELIPIDEAIIYRNFVQGAGARAIAVGYPDGLHIAFDANDLRLALLWKGAFMNAQRHWSGRGQGYEPPAGEEVKKLVEGVAIATLPSADAAWPSQSARESKGYQFRGYRLQGELQTPTFFYQVGDVKVADTTETYATETATTLRRSIELDGTAPQNTFLRLAAGKIDRATGAFELDSGLKIKVLNSNQDAKLRTSGGATELLIPLADNPKIELEYVW